MTAEHTWRNLRARDGPSTPWWFGCSSATSWDTMERHVRSDAPGGRPAGRDSQVRLRPQSAAIFGLHRSIGNRAVTRLLLRDPHDDFTAAAAIVAALGGGS